MNLAVPLVRVAGATQVNSITMQFLQVPEPGSLAVLAFGIAAVGVNFRRRERGQQ